jgi:DNA invertase Pin-like site-specific DNA recombinase
MGRLTLNVLLSFAQFEREVTGEHIRDKISTRTQEKIQAFLKTIVTRVAAASGPPPSIASSDRQN